MAFEPGQRIGDYEVVAKLGAGGLGVVYEVRHLISQRCEAMKILLPEQMGTQEMVERFRREVQTLATLSHPNIAALHTAFYYENQLAMVIELVHGETLGNLRRRGEITLPQLLDFAAQILRALVYAHNLGVVHRDIKPANIMIDQIGVVKLLDFGIAITNHSSELTQKGYMLGSLNYMSPEQINGSKATAQSDIYSLGVTLYEIMTGALPITGNSNYEIMIGHMQRVPVPPYQLAPQVPIAISDAIMRSLAKDPAHRFANADEFLRALHLNPGARELAVAATLPLPNQAIDALQSSGGFPQTSGGLPQSSGGFPPTSGGFPQTSGGFQQQKPTSPSGSHNLPLDEVSRKLAVFIGPVAKFVVKKLAAQSDDVDFIYREAAKQIGSDTDRAAFLKSRSR